jgi:hypothetical protein
MSCPQCQSEEWKSAQFMYETNQIVVDTSQEGGTLGGGLSTGGVGVGYARTSSDTTGTHAPIFSKKIEPPEVPMEPGEDTPFSPQIWKHWHVFARLFAVALTYGAYSDGGMVWAVIAGVFFILFLKQWIAFCYWCLSWMISKGEAQRQAAKKAHDEGAVAFAKWKKTRICQRCGCAYIAEIEQP